MAIIFRKHIIFIILNQLFLLFSVSRSPHIDVWWMLLLAHKAHKIEWKCNTPLNQTSSRRAAKASMVMTALTVDTRASFRAHRTSASLTFQSLYPLGSTMKCPRRTKGFLRRPRRRPKNHLDSWPRTTEPTSSHHCLAGPKLLKDSPHYTIGFKCADRLRQSKLRAPHYRVLPRQ